MLKKLILGLAAAAALTTSAPARAESELDFTLVNKTGYGIKAIYIGPSSSKEWGENIIEEVLADGESVEIEFSPKAKAKTWDLMITWEEDGFPDEYWTGARLAEISKITLKYDRKTDTTSAVTE